MVDQSVCVRVENANCLDSISAPAGKLVDFS